MTGVSSDFVPPAPAPLTGERVAFTGTLASMTHREAGDLVQVHGGIPVQHISQQTTLLVVGEEGWPLEADGQPSVKLLQAQAWQERGSPLRILSESEWLSALGLESPTRTQQLCTPALLSHLLGVSVHEIRRWERLQLIRPVRRVMRLPYFDFGEVSAARRLAELVASGVSLTHVAQSFERLQSLMPGVKQPLMQLQILAGERELLVRDPKGWVEPSSGQRRLPFEDDDFISSEVQTVPEEDSPTCLPFEASRNTPRPEWTAKDWHQHGCRQAEVGQLGDAVHAFRSALLLEPTAAELHFHLADILYRMNRPWGAIERYRAAVEHDHDFIEAWTQLGCVLVEQSEFAEGREAFEIALDRHPEFPDAHFHLANLLEKTGDHAAARPHWEAYLTADSQGPWAEVARQHLQHRPIS